MLKLIVISLFLALIYGCRPAENTIAQCDVESADSAVISGYHSSSVKEVNFGQKRFRVEESFHGKYGLSVSARNPYAFSVRISNVAARKTLVAEMWHKKSSGKVALVMKTDSESPFYLEQWKGNKESNGWEKISLHVLIPDSLNDRELLVYAYSFDTTEAIVDDFVLKESYVQVKKVSYGEYVDPRDGEKYRTVKIGNTTWLADHLRHHVAGSRYYHDDSISLKLYGRLYDHSMALKAVPPGWHLPTDKEYMELESELGISQNELNLEGFRGTSEGRMLMPGYSSGMDIYLSGARTDNFYNKDRAAYLWTSTQAKPGWYYVREIGMNSMIGRFIDSTYMMFSVRAVRD